VRTNTLSLTVACIKRVW